MKGLIVFNHLNDIIYLNCCTKFVKHVEKLADTQGLVSSKHSTFHGKGEKLIDPNILIQLFSPLVTSHRFMKEQFGNPYSSVQCAAGTNIVFQDYMGFLFVRIGYDDLAFLRRALGVCIAFVTYICGPDVAVLKASKFHSELLDHLLDTWTRLYQTDQSFLVEAVEQMVVNIQVSSALIKTLEQGASKVRSYGSEHVHSLLFLENKLLSWYSTRRSYHLTSDDLLFLMTLCQKTWPLRSENGAHRGRTGISSKRRVSETTTSEDEEGRGRGSKKLSSSGTTTTDESDDDDDDSYSSSYGYFDSTESLDIVGDEEVAVGSGSDLNYSTMKHYFILLKSGPNLVPHRVHVSRVQNGLYFVLVCEPSISAITVQTSAALQLVCDFQESRRDTVRDKHFFDLLDTLVKKILEFLKKQKNVGIRNELISRWDRFRAGFSQYTRTRDPISLQLSPITDILRETFRAYFSEKEVLRGIKEEQLEAVRQKVHRETKDFWDFLRVKASRNTTLGCKNTLTIDKYLEEFPGLVHFIYVDRNQHWVTMPALDFNRDETVKLTRKKIWEMVTFSREHMQQGHFSLMWKDSSFNYAYFLWFEDTSGQPIRPKNLSSLPWNSNLLPGILCGDFYKRLLSEVFPPILAPKVRCLELYCIHLGLATSSCVLEHSKRLATTICEVTGTPHEFTQ